MGQKLGTFMCSENHEDMLVLEELIDAGRSLRSSMDLRPGRGPAAVRYVKNARAQGKVVIAL